MSEGDSLESHSLEGNTDAPWAPKSTLPSPVCYVSLCINTENGFLGTLRHTLVHLALHPNGLKQFTRKYASIYLLSLSLKRKKKKKDL